MPKLRLSHVRVLAAAAATAVLISACGGGGGTSSGGGAGGTGTSAVSGNVTNFGSFAFNQPAVDALGVRMLAAIGNMLVTRAYAQAGLTVEVNGLVVTPDDSGAFRIEGVESGAQVVTVSNGDLTCTITIDVPPGSEVVLEDISFAEGNCSVAHIQVVVLDESDDDGSDDMSDDMSDDGSDDMAGDEMDDDTAGAGQTKVTLCHKQKNTITVGAPAVDAHLAHGDEIGTCEEVLADNDEDDDGGDNDSDGDGQDDDSMM